MRDDNNSYFLFKLICILILTGIMFLTLWLSQDNVYAKYIDNELIYLARVINVEASDICDDEHKELVGAVVMNRVKDKRFPNTIWSVTHQKGQYSCINNKKFWSEYPSQRSINAAKKVLDGKVNCPANVIFQAEFVQGKGVYKTKSVNTKRYKSNTYFCYG